MEKYLFTDGTSGVKEVSQEELATLIRSATHTDKIRIWVFNTHEWISYADFSRLHSGLSIKNLPDNKNLISSSKINSSETPVENLVAKNGSRAGTGKRWIKKSLLFTLGAAAIFLIYNFTRIKWVKAPPLNIVAAWPANVVPMNVDTVIQEIENTRGQKLDKITRTNLRIRNTWPDRILLQLNAAHDSGSAGSRFHDVELSIDNTTGYNLDNAIVKLTAWKNSEVSSEDTFHFKNISYSMPVKRMVAGVFRVDSFTVSFAMIKAKVFNFCYSADKKSNYGSNIDKWFCRE